MMTPRVMGPGLRSELTRWLLAIVLVGALVGDGLTGVRDDQPPDTGDGGPGRVVYRMGAIYFEPGHADFTVACTNIGPKPLHVVLEIYDEHDRRTGTPAKTEIAPGATRTFASSPTVASVGDVVIAELPPIDHGKARVSAKRGEIVCTATARLHGDDGETREVPFALMKRIAPAHADGHD
jgi:hypothetical protein